MYIVEIIIGTSSPECLNYWDAYLPGLLHSPFGIPEREKETETETERKREREGKERRKKKEEKVTKHFQVYIVEIIRGTSSPECLNYWDASHPGLLHSPFGILGIHLLHQIKVTIQHKHKKTTKDLTK